MPKFRKKPVEIEAIQWTGNNITEVVALGGTREVNHSFEDDALEIETLEGTMKASKGDWIIKGVKGELYPCKPDIFMKTYEPVDIESSFTPEAISTQVGSL